jgi:hypothetical protein
MYQLSACKPSLANNHVNDLLKNADPKTRQLPFSHAKDSLMLTVFGEALLFPDARGSTQMFAPFHRNSAFTQYVSKTGTSQQKLHQKQYPCQTLAPHPQPLLQRLQSTGAAGRLSPITPFHTSHQAKPENT